MAAGSLAAGSLAALPLAVGPAVAAERVAMLPDNAVEAAVKDCVKAAAQAVFRSRAGDVLDALKIAKGPGQSEAVPS